MSHIETDIGIHDLEEGDWQDLGAGAVMVRCRFTTSPGAEWRNLFTSALAASTIDMLKNAAVTFQADRLQYMSGSKAFPEKRHELLKAHIVDVNRRAKEHNEKEDAAHAAAVASVEANKVAYEDFKNRMKGK